MATRKEVTGFGMPWEDVYGYAQAVKVDDTIYVSGQLSHDAEGSMVGATPPDMEAQMRQTYVNAKKVLAKFGATLDDVVEEVIYVTDMDTAFAAAGPVRKEAYGSPRPAVARTAGSVMRRDMPLSLVLMRRAFPRGDPQS